MLVLLPLPLLARLFLLLLLNWLNWFLITLFVLVSVLCVYVAVVSVIIVSLHVYICYALLKGALDELVLNKLNLLSSECLLSASCPIEENSLETSGWDVVDGSMLTNKSIGSSI